MKVFVSQPIATEALRFLSDSGLDLEVSSHKPVKEELIIGAKNSDAMISLVTDRIDGDIIKSCKSLKVIANVAVGFDNIDVKSASRAGIYVTNTPGVLEQSVAELTFAHMLAVSRKLIESDKYIRDGRFKEWALNLFIGNELYGKTLGIVGLGRVGRALMPIARAFGMKIVFTNKSGTFGKSPIDKEISCVSLATLLKESDYVVLAVPLNEDTRHLIKLNELKLMKKTSVLVNVARGPVVCEADLVEALKNNLISGACLDVHEFEPNVSSELIRLSNTILTPHIGTATKEARMRMALCAAQNVVDILSGNSCANIVNNFSL